MTDNPQRLQLAPGRMNAPSSTRVPSIIDVRNTEKLFAFSKAAANSGLVPSHYRNRPDAVMIAIAWGYEIGISPMQALQNIAVINGRPSIWGDLGRALLLGSGKIKDLQIFLEVDGKRVDSPPEDLDTMVGVCTLSRTDNDVEVRSTFSYPEARLAKLLGKDTPWRTYPGEMCKWRAFWRAAREGAADLLAGMSGAEETYDAPEPLPLREVVSHGVKTEAKLLDALGDDNTKQIQVTPESAAEEFATEPVWTDEPPDDKGPDPTVVRITINAMLEQMGKTLEELAPALFERDIDLNETPLERMAVPQMVALRDALTAIRDG